MTDSDLESIRNLTAALFRLEKSQRPEDIERVLSVLVGWLEGQPDLRRAFTTWLVEILLLARWPGERIPQVADLREVKSMLAERVKEWTEEWKQQGRQEGSQESIEQVRAILRQNLEKRFGPLSEEAHCRLEAMEQARATLLQDLEERFGAISEEARRRLEAISSLADLLRLYSRLGPAPDLAALSLTLEQG